MSLSANFEAFQSLPKSSRMPVLFLGHGSPMNAIEDNEFRRSWQALGAAFGAKYPKPKLILCISAHWLTDGWVLTGMAQPRTLHDFGGFPQALFDQQYPAPGAPEVVQEMARVLKQPSTGQDLAVDRHDWGFDHGSWSVIKPMFPQADIPLVQLSMDYHRPPAEHLALGQQLKSLRERGVLIVGSGNIVHNLRAFRIGLPADQAYDWAVAFDLAVTEYLQRHDDQGLCNFRSLGATAQLAHPTHEHYLPLLYAAGAVNPNEAPQFFNVAFQAASISMRSVVWG
jgi:4,5-DOPA dioxygenase extradiol